MKTFNQLVESDNTVMVVDALNLAFRWKHSGALDFADDYIKTVNSLRKSYKAKYVIIACDKGSSSYRKSIYSEYKQNRKDKFDQQSEEDRIKFEMFFEEFQNTLTKLEQETDFIIFRFDKVEADDITAYLVKYKKKLMPNINKMILISSDKDWDLLINKDVSRFSYVTRKEITMDNWSEHYDCEQEDYISIKCLQGDTGDNVPGVPGIGPKKAIALVKEYGSTYDIIANLPISSKYKYIQSLNEFGPDRLMKNYQLMDLLEFCNEALGEENCEFIKTTIESTINA